MRIDPAIQQLFDESSADLRRRMSDLGAELEESKERHAQRTKEITERFAAEERALLDKFENAMEKPQPPHGGAAQRCRGAPVLRRRRGDGPAATAGRVAGVRVVGAVVLRAAAVPGGARSPGAAAPRCPTRARR
nr:hypothetical protein GCM10020241_42760 [Streptoalloteichus tenebrarius]